MCANPLVLAMYTASYQSVSAAELPDTRTAFYAEVIRELLVMRRARQFDSRRARVAALDQRQILFGRLALANMLDDSRPANLLTWADAVGVTKDVTGIIDDSEAEAVFAEIEVETGVVEEARSHDTLQFIRRYLLRVLCSDASRAHYNGQCEALVRLHDDHLRSGEPQARTRLLETIPFTVAQVPKDQVLSALDMVFDLDDPELFARCMLETQAYTHHGWNKYVEGELGFFRTGLSESMPTGSAKNCISSPRRHATRGKRSTRFIYRALRCRHFRRCLSP